MSVPSLNIESTESMIDWFFTHRFTVCASKWQVEFFKKVEEQVAKSPKTCKSVFDI